MAIKIYITGNFLVAEDSVSRTQFFKVNKKGVHHQRSADDDFSFFQEGLFPQGSEQPQYLQLGAQTAWEWNTTELEQQSQTTFPFSDIVDGVGVAYPDADTFDQYLNDNLGVDEVVISGGSGFLTYVAHDATLTGDGTPAFPLKVVPLIGNYEERFDPFLPLVGGAWHVISLAGLPSNRLVEILCGPQINNQVVGIREIGSLLNRSVRLDVDSSFTMTVRTNALGQIEIFATSLSNDFYVTAYLF